MTAGNLEYWFILLAILYSIKPPEANSGQSTPTCSKFYSLIPREGLISFNPFLKPISTLIEDVQFVFRFCLGVRDGNQNSIYLFNLLVILFERPLYLSSEKVTLSQINLENKYMKELKDVAKKIELQSFSVLGLN